MRANVEVAEEIRPGIRVTAIYTGALRLVEICVRAEDPETGKVLANDLALISLRRLRAMAEVELQRP